MDNDTNQQLLEFFRALAEPNRLKIIGFLAQEEHSVDQLSTLLGLSVSTTSHHLQTLAHAGLVTATPRGHYFYYSLNTNNLRIMAQQILQAERLQNLAVDAENMPDFDRKVLKAFTDSEGKIRNFPVQEKKYLVLMNYVLQAFEPGVQYTEKQVNEILLRYNDDTASLRRGLVDYGLMERESGGGKYWRNDGENHDPG